MMTLQRQQTQHGFTMVELIITIGILAVLTAFATPAVTKTMRKTQLNREVGAVVEALQSARSEAVIRRRQCSAQLRSVSGELSVGVACGVTGEIMPSVNIRYAVVQPEDLRVEYDFMGRSPTAYNSPNNCINIIMRHTDDPNVVASIEVREVGSPDILKLEQSQCR